MNLFEASHLARDLMRLHGLAEAGWTFGFDHARRRFGKCDYTRKRIWLSRPLTLLNGIDEVRDTVLHEIAHAMCPGDGHGTRWRTACRRIGAKPQRCYTDQQVISPPRAPAPYRLGCPRCDWWVARRRRPKRRAQLICLRCRGQVELRAAAIP